MRNADAGRALRAPLLTGLAMGLAVMLLPLAALGDGGDAQTPPLLPAGPTPVIEPSDPPVPGEWDGSHTLRVLQKDGAVVELTVADYLWRVVAAEMPASFFDLWFPFKLK